MIDPAHRLEMSEPSQHVWEKGSPAQDCADEADDSNHLIAHPLTVALDDAFSHLAHEIDIVVKQAASAVMRSDCAISIEVKGTNPVVRWRRGWCHVGAKWLSRMAAVEIEIGSISDVSRHARRLHRSYTWFLPSTSTSSRTAHATMSGLLRVMVFCGKVASANEYE